jgi:hypothetical protein
MLWCEEVHRIPHDRSGKKENYVAETRKDDVAETRKDEHDRLQRRTDELKSEHHDLALDQRPYDQAEHDAHTANLKKHKADLLRHQNRRED